MRPKAVSAVEERFYLRFIEDMWNIPRAFAGHGYGNHICFCSNSPKVLCKLPYDHNAISVACCVFRISFLQPCKCEFTIQTIFFRKPFYTEFVKLPQNTAAFIVRKAKTVLVVHKASNLFCKAAFQRMFHHNRASCATGIAEIFPAHTFNLSRDDAVYWRKDMDDVCPRISQIRGAGISASSSCLPIPRRKA